MSRPTTLYRFFDASGNLLYVGITSARRARWEQHAATKEWQHEVRSATTEHFTTHTEAAIAEARAIRDECPRHNVRRPEPDAVRPPIVVRPHRRADGVTGEAADPVGSKDIAERTGVQANTVHVWMRRGLLPPARWIVSGMPAWDWNLDIVPWLLAHPRRAHMAGARAGCSV